MTSNKKNTVFISVVIPVYNEEKNILDLVKRLIPVLSAFKRESEIIFVDDNSTDGTVKLLEKLVSKNISFIVKQGKKGKSYSLIEGFKKAKGEILVMIDGDLQYPPEAITDIVYALSTSDIAVAKRKEYKVSKVRKVMSNSFRNVFGKTLFGLDHDIQSGLKGFKRHVIELINFSPASAWTFDLEFIHRARHAGFTITNVDIRFSPRTNGASNISFAKSSFDIGINSLKLRMKSIHPVMIKPQSLENMIGAGIGYKKNRYITHTTIPHHLTALKTVNTFQKITIFALLGMFFGGLVVNTFLTLQVFVAVLSSIYFIDVFFNLFVVMKSLSFPQEVTSSDKEILALKDKDLPVYTILCPLYKEAHIIPQFMEAIEALSWPKEKLDVMLLLEEDDTDSIDKAGRMDLPEFVRIIVVPHSIPKTKPKACNYGLAFAKGEYLVIYDAEDIPDVLQLKKAYLGFQKVGKKTICLQAKLNYYNPHQNLLTRFFTAEYSLWFDVTLTGLQSIGTTIPLGGTSNHFKTESLKEVEGWDSFNVTEDADLGMRLFKKGYKTAIIDSITLEEANSKFKNWLKQRSRWIKGYMQTYLVHSRGIVAFTKEQKHHALIFQLIIGGKIAFVLINPILWLATISYFVLYAYVGVQIEALYPSYVFYMAVTSLIFGNFLFLYYYMIGVAKKGQWSLMKYIFLIPLYWIMISMAAAMALYQLVFKPHYWEKTVHGFHLKKKEEIVPSMAAAIEERNGFVFPNPFKKRFNLALVKTHSAAGMLIFANAAASVLGFAYSAYLGRALSFEDYALIGLMNGLFSVVAVIFGSLGRAITYKTGYLLGRSGEEAAISFWARTRTMSIKISIVISILWILISPLLLSYFNLLSFVPLFLFAPILLVISATSIDRGFLLSRFDFKKISALTIIEPSIKFILAVLLVYVGLKNWAYATIPATVVVGTIIGWVFVKQNGKKIKNYSETAALNFPLKFLFVSLLSGISAIIFLNLDVIMAKHYLSATDAGLYSLTALIGKMVFFLGALASPFTIAFVSRREGESKDTKKFLYITILGTLLLSLPAFAAIALFGNTLIPFLFGAKVYAALPFLTLISFAMVCFSVASVFTDYYLARKYYSFPFAAFVVGVAQLLLLEFFHSSVWTFVLVMSGVWIMYLCVNLLLHAFSFQVKMFENNMADLFGLFLRLKTPKVGQSDRQRILIFNWRDTKHKWAGGAEVYIHELAKRFVKDGNSVTIFCGNVGKLPKNEVIEGIQIYRRGGFYMVYAWAAVYYLFKFRGKYDVIIDSENGIPFFTPLYSSKKKFLLIHHVHQEVFRKNLRKPFAQLAVFLEAKLMPVVYRNTQVITVSPSSKAEILKHKLTKTDPIVIYNGVDLDLFKPGVKSKTPTILYVGRLQRYKSIHVLLKAAKKILEAVPTAEIIIAGEGEERSRLMQLSKDLGLEGKVTFKGKVTEAEKIWLFQRAWVFVNPSLMEGWGITTIEANACGTAVVASNVPGLKDSVQDTKTGLLVPYGNADELSTAVIELIKNDRKRKKMSEESKVWVENFTWEKSADSFSAIMKNHKTVFTYNVAKA